jgi:hypothetical protein
MANEYLQRTPTSTGNRKVWTISVWIKLSNTSSTSIIRTSSSGTSAESGVYFNSSRVNFEYYNGPGQNYYQTESPLRRDFSSWSHVLVSCDSTKVDLENERTIIYVNGVRTSSLSADTPLPFNTDTFLNLLGRQVNIGSRPVSSADQFFQGEMCDFFFIDGQALTPDVFGFNKVGKGYISVGSTQSTDFRPGQWVPKTPRVIKTAINNNGGFGVNGFYLPMNDSNNFGADFHGTPNSIIKLQENLPQPRCRIDGVGDYTGALRDDPFKQYLVLALPFVSGGLSSGFGDYSAAIKGSGSAKTITNSGVSIATTASYYGSAAYNNATGGNGIQFQGSDFAFGTGDFCVEGWFNVTDSSSIRSIFDTRTSDNLSTGLFIGINSSDEFYTYGFPSGTGVSNWMTPTPGQWNHFAVTRQSNTGRVFINGSCVGIVTNMGSANYTEAGGTALRPSSVFGNLYPFFGYLQDLRVYKGVAKYTGGFDVPRPYTPVGIATWRAVPDTTANNFATLNPLAERQAQKGTISAGNLRYDGTLNQQPEITSTVGVSAGKWYYEVYTGTKGDGGDSHFIGICNRSANSNGTTITIPSANTSGTRPTIGIGNRFSTQLALYDQDNIYDISGTSGWWADGSVVGFAFDINNNSVSVYKNGVLGFTSTVSLSYVATGIGTTIGQGAWSPWLSFESSASRTPASNWVINFGQNPSFSGNTTAGTFTDSNGRGLFKYQPPSGFLALCEDNLPTPAIANPGRHFRTVLWTGDGNSGRSIVGVGFTPDLVWIKSRSNAYAPEIFDSVRGSTLVLYTNGTNVESAETQLLTSFNSDGFSIGNNVAANGSGNNHVAWCWKAGAGTTSTNTSGSITSVVSVNQDAGFSIVSYTGTGSAATVGHGLGRAPAMYITKGRGGPAGTTNWDVYHKSLGPDKYLQLNSTNAAGTSTTLWQNTNPTSSVFYLSGSSGDTNGSGSTYIAYCWAEIEGYSKAFSYVGNGSADGPFVYTGHRPAFVMIKRTDSTANWFIFDNSRNSTNPNLAYLVPNATDIESSSGGDMDFLSNGFKIRNTSASLNASGGTYIGMSFAESPFTTANGK